MKKGSLAELNDLSFLLAAREKKKVGDNTPYNMLSDRYYSYITAIVVSFEKRIVFVYNYFNREDLLQEALIAFYKAVDTFDPNAKVLFTSYMYTLIYRRLLDVVIKANKSVKMEEVVEYSDEKDSAITPLEYTIREEEKSEMLSLIDEKLSSYEAKVIKLYIQGFSNLEIANICFGNTSEVKKVANAISRAKKKLQNNE